MKDALSILHQCGIQATPQRLAVVEFMYNTTTHPSAEEVLKSVRVECPTISRATVYNTLNLLVEKGLLSSQILKEGTIVFDPNIRRHHHFIDEKTGRIYDIPWEAIQVKGEKSLRDFEVHDFQVILKGLRKKQ